MTESNHILHPKLRSVALNKDTTDKSANKWNGKSSISSLEIVVKTSITMDGVNNTAPILEIS